MRASLGELSWCCPGAGGDCGRPCPPNRLLSNTLVKLWKIVARIGAVSKHLTWRAQHRLPHKVLPACLALTSTSNTPWVTPDLSRTTSGGPGPGRRGPPAPQRGLQSCGVLEGVCLFLTRSREADMGRHGQPTSCDVAAAGGAPAPRLHISGSLAVRPRLPRPGLSVPALGTIAVVLVGWVSLALASRGDAYEAGGVASPRTDGAAPGPAAERSRRAIEAATAAGGGSPADAATTVRAVAVVLAMTLVLGGAVLVGFFTCKPKRAIEAQVRNFRTNAPARAVHLHHCCHPLAAVPSPWELHSLQVRLVHRLTLSAPSLPPLPA